MTEPTAPPVVLVVDDEESIRTALQRHLARTGFTVRTAGSAGEALHQLRGRDTALLLSDIRMPGMSGIELVSAALAVDPDLAIVMLSAVNDATTASLCIQRGAMDYITKPFDLTEVGRALLRALRRRDALLAGRHAPEPNRADVASPGADLQRERARLERISVATLEALVNALEAKDPYMRGHSARIADLSATVAVHLGLPDERVDRIRTAGRLHDIGKIGTREAVLLHHGPLTPEEFAHVKQHVLTAAQILAPLTHLADAVADIRGHHERWDGTGYPDGLRGTDIPIGARVIAAAEVFDALSTPRPYQERLAPEAALARLAELAGTALDPEVCRALADVVRKRQTLVFLEDDAPTDPAGS
jgi:response regulator RpfG family c-di-GMP phosphodiesterase